MTCSLSRRIWRGPGRRYGRIARSARHAVQCSGMHIDGKRCARPRLHRRIGYAHDDDLQHNRRPRGNPVSGHGGGCVEALQRVTDLFLSASPSYSDEQIALFDDVFNQLVANLEISVRAMLANRLAPVPNAPPMIIRTLAFDGSIEVAGPVLTQSKRLDDPALIHNARSNGERHLLAISRRNAISEAVTDVLLTHGSRQVVLSVAGNSGAKFSDSGFAVLFSARSMTILCGDRGHATRYSSESLPEAAGKSVRSGSREARSG